MNLDHTLNGPEGHFLNFKHPVYKIQVKMDDEGFASRRPAVFAEFADGEPLDLWLNTNLWRPQNET